MAESRKVGGTAGVSRSQKDRAGYISPRVLGVRTDRSGKGATDAGLTPAQKASVLAEESRVRKFKTEYAAVINPRGEVVRRLNQGRAHGVSFSGVPSSELKDAVVIHNHPQRGQIGAFGDTLATRIGSPLSAQDLVFAAHNDLAEMRAVGYSGNGGGYVYSIRRPAGGWRYTNTADLANLKNMTRREGQRLAQSEFDRVRYNPSGSGEIDRQRKSRGELIAQWRSIQEMARELGTTITRRKF